jgi:hypothetical protein
MNYKWQFKSKWTLTLDREKETTNWVWKKKEINVNQMTWILEVFESESRCVESIIEEHNQAS